MSTPKSGSNDRKPHTAGGARELTPEEEKAELDYALGSSDEEEPDSESDFTDPGSDEEDSSSEESPDASLSRSNSAEGELEESEPGYALNEEEAAAEAEIAKVWVKGYREEIKRQEPVQKGLDTKQENRRLQEAKKCNWDAIEVARNKGDEKRAQEIVRLIREFGHLNVAEMLREDQAAAQDARKMREEEKAEREQPCLARDPEEDKAMKAAKQASLMDALTGGAHATGGASAMDPPGGSLGGASAASSSRGGGAAASSSRGGGAAASSSRDSNPSSGSGLLGRILGAQQAMSDGTAFFQRPRVTGLRLHRTPTHEGTVASDPGGQQDPKRQQPH